MRKEDEKYRNYLQILQEELIPAMGCTEPIAIAYAAAKAKELLGEIPTSVVIEASGNIVKNVKSVVVPNTGGLKGIEAAAAAGIVAGRPELSLEVISGITQAEQEKIKKYLENTAIKVMPLKSDCVLDIQVCLRNGDEYAKVRISETHTNITHMEKNGEILLEKRIPGAVFADTNSDRAAMNVWDIWDFAETVDMDDVRNIISRQIDYNMEISRTGLAGNYGANVGRVLATTYGHNDVVLRAKAAAAAGSDARMSGCELPVIINSGSGNQGITVSVPVVVYAEELGVGEEQMYRALVLSNLLAIHQKTRIGRLSAYCGAVSAGAAAGAAIAYLHGGSYNEIIHTLVNALAIVSGIICDGAKPSCAAKIAAAVDAGILGYHMYQEGQQFYGGDGIISKGVEATLENIGRLGKDGMRGTDEEIIRIMTGT